MKLNRSSLILLAVAAGCFALQSPLSAQFLRGTWIVRCKSGHDDRVEGLTRNHDCEKCGEKSVNGGKARVVCPDGHARQVEGITESHLCQETLASGGICGKQCRR